MELLERDRYLAELAEWLCAVGEHGGCIALVGGEAGIGKTVLLQEFSKRQRDVRVLWGACDALYTPRPLAPLHDIVRQIQGALPAAINSGANRDVIFAATLDELERAKSLVVFEDLHWADEATLDLLKYLGRRIRGTRTMLTVTYRDEEVGPRHPLRIVMGELSRASTHRMTLAPLSAPAVAQLARQAGKPAANLHSVTGGNPFFVTEALAVATDTMPASVRDAVLARASRLSPAARTVAELACIVPNKTEGWLLEQTVAPDEASIEGCLSIGMVRGADGAIAFRHELARRALEDSLPQARRQLLHAMVLAVLAPRLGVSTARLAHHADGARDAEGVLRFAPLSATQAASVGAHREAASHYQVALRYAENLSTVDCARLQEQLSYECYLTGQFERAIEARSAALSVWRSLGQRVEEGGALRWLSRLSWFAGRRAEADQYGAEAIKKLESLPPSPELAMAYCGRAELDMEAHEADSAIELAQRAITLAEPWAHAEILIDALNTLGLVRLIGGDTTGWADLDRSLQLALAGRLEEQVASAYTSLGAMAVSHRLYDQASRYLNAGLAYCEAHDLDFSRPYMLAYSARMKFEQGDWHGAGEDVEAVLRHPRTTSVTRMPALRTLGHLRIRRGDPDANTPLEEVRSLAGPVPELQQLGTLAAVHAEAAWLAGDREALIRAVRPAYELSRQRRDPRMNGELAAWLWRVDALGEPPTNMAQPYALEISGDWRGAVQAWKSLGCPYEFASLLAWHGTEAEQREALVILEQLGAAPAAQALRRQMRAQGVRQVPRGSRPTTRRHPHGLTQREAETLALMSEGLRNAAIARRLFVSTKTIDHHVSAILTKLGVHSRAAAIALTRRRPDQAG
jgi:DNA-binding CsgD family transcriptional regulator/tetratricopeptide (TPR) repeat protein